MYPIYNQTIGQNSKMGNIVRHTEMSQIEEAILPISQYSHLDIFLGQVSKLGTL